MGRLTEEEVIHKWERINRAQLERTRALLLEEGRPDLVAELDQKLKDIRMGIDSARGTWHALSEPQRKALKAANRGPLVRGDIDGLTQRYYRDSPHEWWGLRTVRNLISRELLYCDGGAFDPESRLLITERGRFVLKHGPKPCSTGRGS